MARIREGKKEVIDLGNVTLTVEGVTPKNILEAVRQNMHQSTRLAKDEMRDMVVERLTRHGVRGASYSLGYRARKILMGNYTGKVDLQFSGQMIDALEGRGRARPAQDQITVWLNFKTQQRRPYPRSPGARPSGGAITNSTLREILTNPGSRKRKLELGSEDPLGLVGEERNELMQRVARRLMNVQ